MNYIISIINPDSLSILMDLCNQLDLPLSITMAGRGTAVQSMLDLLGIESNERRIVFTVANEEKTKKLIQAQKRHMHIGVPGHGIVIAVPIKSVGGGKTVAFLNGETDNAAYTPSLNYAHELIVAVWQPGLHRYGYECGTCSWCTRRHRPSRKRNWCKGRTKIL